MKAIILATGQGIRLHPTTKVIPKHLLLVYNYPMIFYPLWILERSGVREILIITNHKDIETYMHLLGNTFSQAKLYYAGQDQPQSIIDALFVSEFFVGQEPFVLALGDNLFYGKNFKNTLRDAMLRGGGASAFAFESNKPQMFGVVETDEHQKVIRIAERPFDVQKSWVVSGIYVLDQKALEIAKKCRRARRNELEIVEFLNGYLEEDMLNVKFFDKDSCWFDLGTPDGILEASEFVQRITNRGKNSFYEE